MSSQKKRKGWKPSPRLEAFFNAWDPQILGVFVGRSSEASSTPQRADPLARKFSSAFSILLHSLLILLTFGSAIATYVIAFTGGGRDAEQLANDSAFVVLSYIGAFLPFQVVDAAEFIGPKWKTVREVAVVGWFRLGVNVTGMLTTALYTHFQRVSGDFKEMAAGLIILGFSFLNTARTTRGLIELFEFRRWAVVSIDTLQYRNIPFRITGRKDEICTPGELSLALKVNESIIDDKLYSGRTVSASLSYKLFCALNAVFLRDREQERKLRPRPFNVIMHRSDWAPSAYQQLMPLNPIDLWLDWAAVFAAQGLRSSLRVADSDGTIHNRKARYLPAGPYLRPSRNFRKHLQEAMESGVGLPYDAPQITNNVDENVRGNRSNDGFQGVTYRLARTVEDLSIEFGPDILKFDVTMLEHLTVLLHGKEDVTVGISFFRGP